MNTNLSTLDESTGSRKPRINSTCHLAALEVQTKSGAKQFFLEKCVPFYLASPVFVEKRAVAHVHKGNYRRRDIMYVSDDVLFRMVKWGCSFSLAEKGLT